MELIPELAIMRHPLSQMYQELGAVDVLGGNCGLRGGGEPITRMGKTAE